jgi:alkylation response protein AidB-like acyl-CoA dehydrogenase
MIFHEKESLTERIKVMKDFSKLFSSRADEIDRVGGFPFENIQDLKETGYTSLTIPAEFGGKEISLYELIRLQEKIAEGDGATALSIGWHMGIVKNLGEKRTWNKSNLNYLFNEVKRGALINSAATEPATGSPTRGGKPVTSAEKINGKWVINGRKSFTTMSPVLDLFIVSATIKENGMIGNFLIPRSVSGISIEETWDSIAMRGTGSHDLVLDNVLVSEDALVEILGKDGKKGSGWLLHIPACYLGIAKAATTYAIQFAKEYSPNSLSGSIIELPTVQQKIGEIELMLMQSEAFLYNTAKQWDECSETEREKMTPVLGAVKLTVTNHAIRIVDTAMRVVGAKSLSAKNPLQRYYRDVRAGLHNPPMDDMTIQLLASHAILTAE